MIKTLKIAFAALVAMVLAVGCAKNSGLDTSGHENQALEAWMEKNVDFTKYAEWMKTDDGTYILWLRKAPVLDPKVDTLAE